MGAVASKAEDGGVLFLKDQTRLSIASLTITNSRRRVLLNIVPNAFPASRLSAKRDLGDDTPVEYIQDPELGPAGLPTFILKLHSEDELNFRFTFVMRQAQSGQITSSTTNGVTSGPTDVVDTSITGLTFAYAPNAKELDNLVTREFHADPNLHKNSNVQLVGDFSTDGTSSVQFDWSWKWRPPKIMEDKGGGWRNSCSFLEYDQRAHRLKTLASFSFWVHNSYRALQSPPIASPGFDLAAPPRVRVFSSQSGQSRISDSEYHTEVQEPPSPLEAPPEYAANAFQIAAQTTASNNVVKVDVSCQRPGEDMSAVEDGPLFRATMKSLEQKTGSMKTRMKKVLRRAEAAQQSQRECNEAVRYFQEALKEASSSSANALQPALEHYFDKIAKEILAYEERNAQHLQRMVIEPIAKLYNYDIKQAEAKKKDFEDESRDYYAYVGRYLGQRQDSLKDKKKAESDSKYQFKRRNFELKRFDYSSFMQDLHGGRKEQEILSTLTRFADVQAKSYLSTAKKVEEMTPQLDALIHEVNEADKEFKFQRTEREEKRRALEKSTKTYIEPDTVSQNSALPTTPGQQNGMTSYTSDTELSRADSTSSQLRTANGNSGLGTSTNGATLGAPSTNTSSTSPGLSAVSPGSNRFKGIRDLEERDMTSLSAAEKSGGQQRKEGLLWALSRPGSHIDPKGINKQAWHKFWIVLDQGRLSEYSNWKQRLDLHMEPIDLRMASVRVARDADRRFCFEVITPHFKRIYQATSEEDMVNWINSINNALQSAVEGRGTAQPAPPSSMKSEGSLIRDIGSVLTGKSSSLSGHHGHSASNTSGVNRRTTVGARPSYVRTDSNSFEDNPSKLLQLIRDADQGNTSCADCGSGSKVEWVSINLGIVLCIECSGIHRSLGTHISKVRSLTLDTHSFTSDIVEILLRVGNRVSNMIWEAKMDRNVKPSPQSNREQRLRFITAKYSERAYINPISTTLSPCAPADETLLTSIKKNDIQGVLYGIALRGNVNAGDRSRNTHAVFLALAAADPAAPASAGNSPSVSPNNKTAPPRAKPVSFPIAELLLQNGAEIPTQKPAIPLSPAAQLYIEQRTGRGETHSQGTGDTLSALPTIRGASGGSVQGLAEREREAKLQKRGSAGGRFAGKVASMGVER